MRVKKSNKANLEKKRGMFLQIGFIVSLSFVLLAFEWTTIRSHTIDLNRMGRGEMIEEWAEVTVHKKKPEMPKPQIIRPIIVPDDTELDSDEIEIDVEITDKTVNEINFKIEDDPDEGTEEPPIFTIVEFKPEFPGGLSALYKYIGDNIEYPKSAKEVGIQGPVHVSFIVWNDGSIRGVEVLRGIGGGCDEEAKRVIQGMPNWKPGKQRTAPVNVQMVIPITFSLSN